MALVKFVQGEEIKKHSSDEIDVEGVCWAQVLRWIAECAKEEESNRLKTQVARISTLQSAVPQAIALQTDYRVFMNNHPVPHDIQNPGVVKAGVALEHLGQRCGVKIDRTSPKEVLLAFNEPTKHLQDVIARITTYSSFHIVSFHYEDGKGHAMGTWREPKPGFFASLFFNTHTLLFDPNGGELDMTNDTLQSFLTSHINNNKAKSIMVWKMTPA